MTLQSAVAHMGATVQDAKGVRGRIEKVRKQHGGSYSRGYMVAEMLCADGSRIVRALSVLRIVRTVAEGK